jgi:hypothetical protein
MIEALGVYRLAVRVGDGMGEDLMTLVLPRRGRVGVDADGVAGATFELRRAFLDLDAGVAGMPFAVSGSGGGGSGRAGQAGGGSWLVAIREPLVVAFWLWLDGSRESDGKLELGAVGWS